MKESDRELSWPYELAALTEDGDELYRTESQDSLEEAEEAAREANQRLENGKVFKHEGKVVDEFIVVETKDGE